MAAFLKPSGGSPQPKAHVAVPLKAAAEKPATVAEQAPSLPEKQAVSIPEASSSRGGWSEKYAKAAVLERARRARPSAIIRQLENADGVALEFQERARGVTTRKAKSWRAMEEDLRPRPTIPFIPAK